ncbi:copper ion binding protein, partial [Lysobacter sp. 2RAB21]
MNATASSLPGLRQLQAPIAGMTCGSCVGRVEKALRAVPGVDSVSVNLATESARVAFTDAVSPAEIEQAVRVAGYTLVSEEIALRLAGMNCGSCVGRIEKALKAVPGVLEASVNLATEQARVRVVAGTEVPALIDAVKHAGYAAALADSAQAGAEPADDVAAAGDIHIAASASATSPVTRETRHLLIAALLTAPLIAPMLALPFGQHWMLPGWLQFALATPVQFWLGARFYRAAWGALRARSGNMDLLVALGTSAGYGLSLYHLLRGDSAALYFETSAAIVTLILLGRWLE